MFKDVWDWIQEKSIGAVRIYEILKFSKNSRFLSNLVLFDQ